MDSTSGRSSDLIAQTSSGRVRGSVSTHARVFRGIPYAAAPIGEFRFAPPRSHAGWTGVRDATQPGPGAPQPLRGQFGRLACHLAELPFVFDQTGLREPGFQKSVRRRGQIRSQFGLEFIAIKSEGGNGGIKANPAAVVRDYASQYQ